MKKILIVLAVIFAGVIILALLNLSPQNEIHMKVKKGYEQVEDITQRPIDQFGNDTGEKMEQNIKSLFRKKVCCRTGAVVPDPVYSYTFVDKDKCKTPSHLDEEGVPSLVVGSQYKIVDDHLCTELEK